MFLWRKINYLCVKIFYIFNKLLCFLHLRRNRKNSGTILPMHMKQTLLNSDITLPVPTNESYESWGVWGDEEQLNNVSTGGLNNLSKNEISNNQKSCDTSKHHGQRKHSQEQEQINDVDYFQELSLEPEIKKAKKIVIRKNEAYDASNRLTMVNDITLSSDLGNLEDREMGGGWSEEEEDVDAVKDKRRLERERRIQEHQRKKIEKDRQRKKQAGGYNDPSGMQRVS